MSIDKNKARFVKVEYNDDEISKLTYKNVKCKTYVENTLSNLYRLKNYSKILPVMIYVLILAFIDSLISIPLNTSGSLSST